jgi:mannose-1-phosphate guanylyltransferase
MILAAGYGTRLRPVTDHIPKPLLPVLGMPLLEVVVRNLQAAGITQIAVNSHHLADQIAAWADGWNTGSGVKPLRAGDSVQDVDLAPALTVFHEPEILGTGGGLVNAQVFLARDDLFLLHNGDVLTDLDLTQLMAEHLQHTPLTQDQHRGVVATLALVDSEPVNSVLLAPDGAVLDISRRIGGLIDSPSQKGSIPGSRLLTYTGVAVLSRDIFRFLPDSGFSSLSDALLAALIERPGSVRGWAPSRAYWNDLGTVGRYLDAHQHLLIERRPALPVVPTPSQPIHIAETASVAAGARLCGFVSLGRECRIESGAQLEDCVVLDRAVVTPGESHHRAVIGTGWIAAEEGPTLWVEITTTGLQKLDLVRSAGFGAGAGTRAQRMVGHGSDRTFWRLTAGDRTAVLMRTTPADEEFSRYITIGAFLNTEDLGGPEILAADAEDYAVLLEDLGDESLYKIAVSSPDMSSPGEKSGSPPVALVSLYRQTLDLLVEIQTRGTASLDRCTEAGDRLFDYETLRFESDYFRQRFLGNIVELSNGKAADPADRELAALDDEFHRLANATLEQPVVLMHRDFQSQNILVKAGRIRLVDFQGMRRGPLAYDLVSLLRDAYVDLGVELRSELREYYRERLAAGGGPALSVTQLHRMVTVAGLQRNMQALGAFGFLSLVKGKSHFRRYIPLCLGHLADGLGELREDGKFPTGEPGRLPRLEKIVARLLPHF